MTKKANGERASSRGIMGKTIAVLLILAGTLLILCVLVAQQVVKRQQQDLLKAYAANQAAASAIDPGQTAGEFQAVLPGYPAETEGEEPAANADSSSLEPICLLRIPTIDLDVVVAEGVNDSVMRYAVGHFPDTALPGETGNFCLSGHRSYAFGQFFNRLDEVEIGDPLIVEQGDQVYTYTVTEKFVVEPEELWVLDPQEGVEITLVTCTPVRIATHRLIIKGVLEA